MKTALSQAQHAPQHVRACCVAWSVSANLAAQDSFWNQNGIGNRSGGTHFLRAAFEAITSAE